MAHDEALAAKIRAHLSVTKGLTEKKMFGGVAFLVNGNMSVGVHKDWLIVRAGPESAASLLREKGAKPMDITGRPMKGWLMIDPAALQDSRALKKWVDRGVAFAAALPKK